MKQYDSYKPSGVEWLGEIPENWEVKRVKDFARTQSGTTPNTSIIPYYENGEYNWVRTTDLNDGELFEVEFKVTELAIKECRLSFLPVDTILTAMYGGFGTIGKNSILKVPSTINQSVCAILPSKKYESRYLLYFLKFFRVNWILFADGARKDPNINQDAIKNLFLYFPSCTEQLLIANYLDAMTTAIDRKIEILSVKAEKFRALRRSLINETVCRGLNPDAPLKDSGVEWIGMIPENWEVKRVKEVFRNTGSGTTPPSGDESYYDDIGINWLQTGDLNDGFITETSKKISQKAKDEFSTLKLYLEGSLVIAMYGATIGKMGYLKIKTATNQACCVLSNLFDNNEKYFFYQLLSMKHYIVSLSTGGGQPNINQDIVRFLRLVTPPITEQILIAAYLDTKTSQIDSIITNITHQISKLTQLRKTLINDVVTGKLKVTE